jgi:hypothetical protein
VGLTTPRGKKIIVIEVEQRKSWMDLTMMERVGETGKKWKDIVRQAKAHCGL